MGNIKKERISFEKWKKSYEAFIKKRLEESSEKESVGTGHSHRVRGIRKRWLLQSLGLVVFILMLTVLSLILSLWGYYQSSMSESLRNQAVTIASTFTNLTKDNYVTAVQEMVNSYEYRTTVEIQFLELDGAVLCTSYGLTSGTFPGTPDVAAALQERTANMAHIYVGHDINSGERIMAVSCPILYQGQTTIGAIRLVTSLSVVDQELFLNSAGLATIALAVLLLVYFSNLYFVRSITESLASITDTARQISEGSYGIQIDKQYDDEIGDLTDTINTMSLKIMQAEKTQSEFISSVSHELRTPLTAITGWAETIQSGELKEADDISKGMDIIVSETRRLSNMVEELLAFSKMQDGRFTLSVEPLDLKAEVEDAVYTYREFFRKESIELVYLEGDSDFLPVTGDPDRLRQVFCNLLDNAAKHGGSGGRIDVSVYQPVEAPWVAVEIRDYGSGIPEEELPHVKYKFYKGSSKARGSGIGLAVCEEIVTRHGGELLIENAPELGCLVTIMLPMESSMV